ncbi:MAG: ATP-binding cassette domain-containing protein [Candidatus Peribacteria bacterium]|nr:MAG: ATP-binding cassette domain-containing protein [Candidatus Peribacteria bacterium]
MFSNLVLKIEKNDFVFVVGDSGVGKTTLLKFLIRQLQPPTKMIFHLKEDIARFTTNEVQAYRRNIGVVHQDFKLIERKNVRQNIAYPLEIL